MDLTKVGVVLDTGPVGSFDAIAVESLFPFVDPESGGLAGVYTGYGPNAAGQQVGSIGLAYSTDGVEWTKAGKLLGGSGIAGSPDQAGCTGPVVLWRDGLFYVFHIGLPEPGYEGGTKRLLLSTTPSLRSPQWTHRGVVLAPGGTGWRAKWVWHPSIVQGDDGRWYCFINATAADGVERIGYATADSLTGPWVFDESALLEPVSGEFIAGDPCVTRLPDGGWRMDYFTASTVYGSDWFTTTTAAAFPRGWVRHDPMDLSRATVRPGPAGSCDDLYAHKPILLTFGGRLFHFYTAVTKANARRVALAVDPPLRWQVATSAIPELVATRTTTAPAATLDKSTVVFDATGRRGLQVRLVVRAYPGPSATVTVSLDDLPGTQVSLRGGGWVNAAGPWESVPADGLYSSFLRWGSSDGSLIQFGSGLYEFRWLAD